MKFEALLKANRSYRRFDQTVSVPGEVLHSLVNLTRFCPSARNVQPLKYVLINDDERCRQVFPLTAWAGYLPDWDGPQEGERPTAYILVLKDMALTDNIFCDDGIAIQTIMLGATELGFGGCIIGSFQKKRVMDLLAISDRFEPLYILALGKPAETVVIEEMTGSHHYWRDEDSVHHVPKRSSKELIFELQSGK